MPIKVNYHLWIHTSKIFNIKGYIKRFERMVYDVVGLKYEMDHDSENGWLSKCGRVSKYKRPERFYKLLNTT